MTTQPTLTPGAFAAKWRGVTTTEKAASQEHFIDLCRMLGEPTPNEADPTGAIYAFEKSVTKAAGGDGFADVWKKDFFGWEYKGKGKGKDLKAAYLQLLGYREDLSNPPLLVGGTLAKDDLVGSHAKGRPMRRWTTDEYDRLFSTHLPTSPSAPTGAELQGLAHQLRRSAGAVVAQWHDARSAVLQNKTAASSGLLAYLMGRGWTRE